MTKRVMTRLAFAVACVLVSAGAASAQQILNFNVGRFTPHGEDSRVQGDVLNADRTFLTFEIKDFDNITAGGEWLAPLGNFFEVGGGLNVYRGKTHSFYTRFIDRD